MLQRVPQIAAGLGTDLGFLVQGIAGHGGFIQLVGLEGETAYVRMGGGCQGCGMAKVTLSQGVVKAILDQVPDVKEVLDITDHASGANPYYQPSGK